MSKSDKYRKSLPKKILIIKDLAYILPENFQGSIEDAILSLVEYKKTNIKNKTFVDNDELPSHESLLLSNTDAKVCGKYGIFEFRDGKYINI